MSIPQTSSAWNITIHTLEARPARPAALVAKGFATIVAKTLLPRTLLASGLASWSVSV